MLLIVKNPAVPEVTNFVRKLHVGWVKNGGNIAEEAWTVKWS
jgi:catabolite regulation protein CreA